MLLQRRHIAIKRLRDDPSDEVDDAVMPTRKNKAPHTSSTPSTTSRAKLQNLVKKKSVVQPQSDAKASSSLSLLRAYSDDSDNIIVYIYIQARTQTLSKASSN